MVGVVTVIATRPGTDVEYHGRTVVDGDLRRFIERKAEAYAALAKHELKVVAGARDFIAAAAGRARIAVVSGALRREIEPGLEAAGVRQDVAVVVSAEDVAAAKPDPEGFRLALRQLSLRHGNERWRAVIIEDSLPGLAAARTLGAGCVMLTTSHHAAALAGADLVWDSFADHRVDELEPLWRAVEPA